MANYRRPGTGFGVCYGSNLNQFHDGLPWTVPRCGTSLGGPPTLACASAPATPSDQMESFVGLSRTRHSHVVLACANTDEYPALSSESSMQAKVSCFCFHAVQQVSFWHNAQIPVFEAYRHKLCLTVLVVNFLDDMADSGILSLPFGD